MRTKLALAFLSCVIFSSHSMGQNQLQGDPEAVALIEKMLARLGGKDIWSRSRSLYIEYHGWRKNPAQAVIEKAWRDLQQPNQRMEIEGTLSDLILVFTPDSSWISRNGEVRAGDESAHRADLDFWPYDFYTVIHNLATADQRLVLEFEPPMRVNILNQDREDWGWWEIDDTGAPIRWGANYEGEVLEYVYGPVRSFGNVSFPAWGTAVDGFWRFEYVEVDVDSNPIPDSYLRYPQ